MDTATLVDERIEDGKRFLDHLTQCDFDVVVAFWALTSYDGRWLLYISSPVVESDGLAPAYQKVHSELKNSQVRSVLWSDVRLIASDDPMALDAIDYQSAHLPSWYRGRKLGNLIIDEAYIYPA